MNHLTEGGRKGYFGKTADYQKSNKWQCYELNYKGKDFYSSFTPPGIPLILQLICRLVFLYHLALNRCLQIDLFIWLIVSQGQDIFIWVTKSHQQLEQQPYLWWQVTSLKLLGGKSGESIKRGNNANVRVISRQKYFNSRICQVYHLCNLVDSDGQLSKFCWWRRGLTCLMCLSWLPNEPFAKDIISFVKLQKQMPY